VQYGIGGVVQNRLVLQRRRLATSAGPPANLRGITRFYGVRWVQDRHRLPDGGRRGLRKRVSGGSWRFWIDPASAHTRSTAARIDARQFQNQGFAFGACKPTFQPPLRFGVEAEVGFGTARSPLLI
jgi:hypothetical protein